MSRFIDQQRQKRGQPCASRPQHLKVNKRVGVSTVNFKKACGAYIGLLSGLFSPEIGFQLLSFFFFSFGCSSSPSYISYTQCWVWLFKDGSLYSVNSDAGSIFCIYQNFLLSASSTQSSVLWSSRSAEGSVCILTSKLLLRFSWNVRLFCCCCCGLDRTAGQYLTCCALSLCVCVTCTRVPSAPSPLRRPPGLIRLCSVPPTAK